MPELPEVETIRRGLEPCLRGAVLSRVRVREPRLRVAVPTTELQKLVGRQVVDVGRRAKYLLVAMDNDTTVIMHLGMSGRILLLDIPGIAYDRHDHVLFDWRQRSRRFEVRFRDPRRFGLIVVAATAALERHALLRHLGPDPFDEEFSAARLVALGKGSRRPIKNLLMDARVVTGIGNIYASEALWRARVNPKTRARRIGAARWGRVRAACIEVLEDALRQGGTTLNDYRDPEGRRGSFDVRLNVYGRERLSCLRCCRRVRRIVQAGRSTFYCPGCQS